jgi:hypothetical protein
MFQFIKKTFSPKQVEVPVNKSWRQGMWVIHEGEPHIIFRIGVPTVIHSVNKQTGETTGEKSVSLDSLRQAHFDEIPEIRRQISRERAKELGYAT